MRDYYVYGLHRPDTGQLFYIGYGRGNRAWQHQAQRQRGRSYKDNILCKVIDTLGYPGVPVVTIRRGLARDEAIDLEAALIHAIGRHPHGPLANVMPGGRRRTPSPAALQLARQAVDPTQYQDIASRARFAWPQSGEQTSIHWVMTQILD